MIVVGGGYEAVNARSTDFNVGYNHLGTKRIRICC